MVNPQSPQMNKLVPRAPGQLRFLRRLSRVLYGLPRTGLPRVAEWMRQRTARKFIATDQPARFWINDFMGSLAFCCDLKDHIGSQIFFRGSYSLEQLQLIQRLFSRPYVFVDVGANQGEFTVFVAAEFEGNRVLAFEPTSQMLEHLKANIAGNALDNVTIYPVGLSDVAQDNVPIYGGSSVSNDHTYNSGLPTIFSMSDRNQLLEEIRLQRLDEVLTQPGTPETIDLIKIDVEGAELQVLRGAVETITDHRPLVIFEASAVSSAAAGHQTADLFGFFVKLGYELRAIGSEGRLGPLDKTAEFSNVLAIPAEQAGSTMALVER